MQISPHVEELQRQLMAAAAAGTAETAEIAGRLAVSLEAAARLAILEALSEAAGEITREIAPGSVDVRLRGRDVEFAVTRPAGDANAATPPVTAHVGDAGADEGEDASTARTTLRWPDSLKARAEAAAAADGLSLNTWLVRAVTAALEPRPAVTDSRGSSYSGWVR